MRRRNFIRHLLTAPLAASAFVCGNPFRPGLRIARAATGKTVVVVFQRGGCDGLNTVIPYRDSEYYRLRPSIAIPKPGSGSGAALNLDGFFGLHPSLAPLYKVYQRGDMAVLPAVHYRKASRSHFSGQNLIESGTTANSRSNGWLNRHLTSFPQTGNIRAVSFGELSHTLTGNAPVSTFDDVNDFLDNNSQTGNLLGSLQHVFNQSVNANETNRRLLHKHSRLMLDSLDDINNVIAKNYAPANGAAYPTSTYGRQMMQVAQLIKTGIGLEAATVSLGGWDTHVQQGGATGRQADVHAEFAAGIAALYKDLGSGFMSDVVILTMTEFGRTAQQNASNGTDHGHASSWFVIGNTISGGIYGYWPGLQASSLRDRRYLDHSIDYRDVLSEIVLYHLGNSNLNAVLPNHAYQSVGFL